MAGDSSYDQARALVGAGANVLHIASYEWERVQGWAIGLAQQLAATLYLWSSSGGLRRYDGERLIDEAPDLVDPIEAMKGFAEADKAQLLVLEDIHPYLEPQHHQPIRWVRELCRLPAEPRKLLLLSTPMPQLPLDLRKEIPTIDLALPGLDDLRTVCQGVAAERGLGYEEDEQLLQAARGLTVMEARLAFGQAAVQLAQRGHRSLGHQAVSLVAREKERVIRQSEVLEYHEPAARIEDVGGLENLKEWLARRGQAFGAGAREYGLDSPKGVLLLGVQGCGKSLMAKAVAASWQFPLLRFDLGKVFGGLVGQSEGNIRTALQVATALAPCVLWIDEIEKGLSGMGSSDRTDGGTTARVVGTLLTWMQEKREPVFVVATANRIDMLPPELLRKGRFDEIFFVDLPTARVRQEVLGIHLKKKKRRPQDFALDRLAELSVGFSGAELEEAVREGLFSAFSQSRELATEHIEEALRATFPLSRTMGDQLGELRRWAKVRARLASREEPEAVVTSKEAAAVPRLRQETRNPFIPPESK